MPEPRLVFAINLASRYELSRSFNSLQHMLNTCTLLGNLWKGKRTKPYRISEGAYRYLYESNKTVLDYLERRGLLIVPDMIDWTMGRQKAQAPIVVRKERGQ